MIGLNAMSIFSVNIESFNLVPEYISNIKLQRTAFNSYSVNYQYQVNTVDTKHYPNRGTISNIGINTSKLFSGRVKTSLYDRMYHKDFPEDFMFRRNLPSRAI
jgi:hypothetical protein